MEKFSNKTLFLSLLDIFSCIEEILQMTPDRTDNQNRYSSDVQNLNIILLDCIVMTDGTNLSNLFISIIGVVKPASRTMIVDSIRSIFKEVNLLALRGSIRSAVASRLAYSATSERDPE